MKTFEYHENGADVKCVVNGQVAYFQIKVAGFISTFDQFNSKNLGYFIIVNN